VSAGGKTPDVGSRTYAEVMREQLVRGEEKEVSVHAVAEKRINFKLGGAGFESRLWWKFLDENLGLG
jgi:hypothetical protein